jgi:hypothetical protein
VFDAIRGVFAGLYDRNAFLDRLRLGVDESQVGMALLVYPPLPAPLANGVARARKSSGSSRSATLAAQIGDSPVSAPEPGALPERSSVAVLSSGASGGPTFTSRSSLLPLGGTVMSAPDDYVDLTNLMLPVLQQYATESGIGAFTLGVDFGLAPDGTFRIDGARRILQAIQPPVATPFLINEPGRYCARDGSEFDQHGLKSSWQLSTLDTWLTPSILATGFYAQSSYEYAETCQVYEQTGLLPGWPSATHAQSGTDLLDGFRLAQLQNPRTVELRTPYDPANYPPTTNTILVLADFGVPFASDRENGCLGLGVHYDQPVLDRALGGIGPATSHGVWLCHCPEPEYLDMFQTRSPVGPAGVSIVTRFYWQPRPLILSEYEDPLSRFVDTTITGLTPSPIVLTGVYSQSYDSQTFNDIEYFLFEPALAPGLPEDQREALEAAGIRAIHVGHDRLASTSTFTYYDDAAWGGPCLECAGFDGDRDGYCTAGTVPDCNDDDPSTWAPPGEVSDLVFWSHELMAWSPPASQGAMPLRYDVLRSTSRSDFDAAAICLESDDDSDIAAVDPEIPAAISYYLIRAEDSCVGSLGHRTDGIERTGRSCP